MLFTFICIQNSVTANMSWDSNQNKPQVNSIGQQ